MDATKRDVIDNILTLAEIEPIVSAIVDEYSIKYKKPRREVIQSHVNDITIDIMNKEIQFRKDTEKMLKMAISNGSCSLNVY